MLEFFCCFRILLSAWAATVCLVSVTSGLAASICEITALEGSRVIFDVLVRLLLPR